MNLRLVKASSEYKDLIIDMLDEWKEYNKRHDTDHSPMAIFYEGKDFNDYMYTLNVLSLNPGQPLVPASTFFALDLDRNIMVGAINIRHYLNDSLLNSGGHIGDGVRPSERRKGFATEIIRLGLIECKKLGIYKVLISCKKWNQASRKTIVRNGGVYYRDVNIENETLEQYWIDNN